jgi:hypothetical protein
MAKKKKRDSVYLQYKCKDGSVTVAAAASIGLMYWYGRILPQKPIENPRPFTIHVMPSPVPSPYSSMFMSLVVAGLERTFGKAPEVPAHLLDAEHKAIETHLKKGTPEIVEYEQVCLDILNWLKERGEITMMIFNEPIQPFGW